MNGFRLALVACIAPNLFLCAVQQIGQHMHVRYRGCRGAPQVHDARLGIHADVRLGAEKPLAPFARLMHLWIAVLLVVLRGRRRSDDRCIDDGAGRDAQAAACQIKVHRVQNPAAQFVLLQQAAEAKNRSLERF
jgi:hypothetical protein